MISVIIPALNEEDRIAATLQRLQVMRSRGNEVILVDGGSTDSTTRLAAPLVDKIVRSEPGRALQMNTGAEQASGEILWFLHADTLARKNSDLLIHHAVLKMTHRWGYFHVRLSGRHPLLRMVETGMNLRTCLTAIATGDQGIFVTKDLYQTAGGFAKLPLMEDIELCQRLKRRHHPARISTPLVTSSRRWEQRGILRTILLMWRLRLAWFFGASPENLARLYR